MSGSDQNCCSLTVKLHDADNTVSADIWSKYGDVRRTWNEASVQLDVGKPFQVGVAVYHRMMCVCCDMFTTLRLGSRVEPWVCSHIA